MRNNKGRTNIELVGTGMTMQVNKILKCSEPLCKYLFSWDPELPPTSFSLPLPASRLAMPLRLQRPERGPQNSISDQELVTILIGQCLR